VNAAAHSSVENKNFDSNPIPLKSAVIQEHVRDQRDFLREQLRIALYAGAVLVAATTLTVGVGLIRSR
jgi:hypothetical protein